MMNTLKKFILVVCIVMISFGLIGSVGICQQTGLTWGTASVGSTTFASLSVLASLVSDNVDYSNNAVSTAGSNENAVLLGLGEIQIGSIASGVIYDAFTGNPPFKEPIDVQQILAFIYWASCPVVALEGSGIETFEDLAGKTLCPGNVGQSSYYYTTWLLEKYGILDEVKFEPLGAAESAEALKSGQIDASTVTLTAGLMMTSPFEELAYSNVFDYVEVDEEILKQVVSEHIGMSVRTAYAEACEHFEKDILTIGDTGILCTTSDMDEETIYQITKYCIENSEKGRRMARELMAFNPEFAYSGLVPEIPVHPGAVRYYKEIGLWEE